MTDTLLKITDLCAGYGERDVIHSLSLELGRGEILAIVGESGCGKSTVLKAVTGLASGGVVITGGEISFDGKSLPALSDEQRRQLLGEELCVVFQNPASALNPIRKIRSQFLETIRSHRRVDKSQALEMIKETFSKLGLSDADAILDCCPCELSGGMCQRVAIALAMVMRPKLILADEPTSALDVINQLHVAQELSVLREKFGASVVLVTHNIALAARIADRIAIMLDGRIVELGATEQILGAPEHEYTRRLIGDVPKLTATAAAVGDEIPLMTAEKLSRRYEGKGRDVLAVDSIDLTLSRGEILGIVGESGSGKSTLSRLLIRLEKPDAGEVRIGGESLGDISAKGLAGLYRREQMVFQMPVSSFSPRRRIRASLRDTVKNLTDKKASAEADAYIDELMALVGLSPELADRYPSQLSGGQCQRAAIARAIAPRPDILICDEATSALDVTVQAEIVRLLSSLVSSLGMAMVFISHDIALVSQLCHRVMVMKDGKCVEQGKTGSVILSPRSEYTRHLLDSADLL